MFDYALTHEFFECDFVVGHQVLCCRFPVLQAGQVHLEELWVEQQLHGLLLPRLSGVLVL